MSPIDNINSGMENLTLIGLRKFNLSGQEFDNNNFPKFVEFEPDNSTKTGNLSINLVKERVLLTYLTNVILIYPRRFLVTYL